MKKILIVVGTRPNFIKITQFRKEVRLFPTIDLKIVHTGQHFAENMSDVFFEQFKLTPDYFLNISQTTPLAQMAETMIRLEELICNEYKPDLILTPGDVNSTLAVSLVANKLNIPLAHIESGLRSFDRSMPEEINRILTDELSNFYFVTEQSGMENLKAEKKPGQAFFVGNTMIDTLVSFQKEIEQSKIIEDLALSKPFVLMTIHRPSNVDSAEGLTKLHRLIERLGNNYQVVFPIHPRTKKNLATFGLDITFQSLKGLFMVDALGYFEFQKLVESCAFVLTDSGGIQEETTYRQIPCLTLRENTERPSTIETGSNTLVHFDIDLVFNEISKIEEGTYKNGAIPALWDGQATKRILAIIDQLRL